MLTANEIRHRFLEYFKKHGFTVELELDNVNYNISI